MGKVFLTGRIYDNLKITKIGRGPRHCWFQLATNISIIRDGERAADYVNCVVWGEQAIELVKTKRRGNLIGIEGEEKIKVEVLNNEVKHIPYISIRKIEYLD